MTRLHAIRILKHEEVLITSSHVNRHFIELLDKGIDCIQSQSIAESKLRRFRGHDSQCACVFGESLGNLGFQ